MTAPFPREVADGVYWISTCLILREHADALHNHNSAFLVRGERGAMLIDTGMPAGWPELARQLELALDGQALTHLLPTHPEVPHMGNLVALVDRYPEAAVVGDLRDYHLFLPGLGERASHRGRAVDRPGRAFSAHHARPDSRPAQHSLGV
jgi:glyoxylase-like metal-dependent hydrolase (beta-lactamase superfamily II)